MSSHSHRGEIDTEREPYGRKTRKKVKNPNVGIVLGILFMVVGLLSIAYPELIGSNTRDAILIAQFTGLVSIIVGLGEVLYITLWGRGEDECSKEETGSGN
jgi:hypothetical protein